MTTRRLPAEKRRKQILRSAIRVFAQATYHGATTKRIAEEAGVTEALIYRYFGSKRALFTDAVQDSSAWLADGLIAVLDEHGEDPQRTATECFAYYARVLERHEDLAKMIFLVLSELDQQDIRTAYLPHQTRALKAIGARLRHWRTLGLVDEELPPEGTAWLLFGTYLILAL
ncbi:MAG: TetR/AcrR family transcriptional regulator, partial [Myxococcales bacterium]|nr:TetR/AcrR family transcriptional regulator [Myxococcales bacterium]